MQKCVNNSVSGLGQRISSIKLKHPLTTTTVIKSIVAIEVVSIDYRYRWALGFFLRQYRLIHIIADLLQTFVYFSPL